MNEQNDFGELENEQGFVELGGDDLAFDPFGEDSEQEDDAGFSSENSAEDGDDEAEDESNVTELPIAQTVPQQKNVTPPAPPKPAVGANPLEAAMQQAQMQLVQTSTKSLFAKAPVFDYAGASEEIADTSQTFEELRISKAVDFPELQEGKRVSWTMEYDKIVKYISKPSETKISALKQEIEQSKEFIEALKKAKNKDFVCKVKPKITAQSKGIAAYKGVFPTLEEAEESPKVICYIPGRDGLVYEMRKNEAGRYITRADNVSELSEISAGFYPALPPIPLILFAQILAFFRHYMRDGRETEVMVHVYWDKELQEYRIITPMQSVGKVSVSVIVLPDETIDEDRYIYVADIHSHNSMRAFFSRIDDDDERATRVYIVVGRLDKPIPEIRARISNGGRFLAIDPWTVIEMLPSDLADDFPSEWTEAVHIINDGFIESPIKNPSFMRQCFLRLQCRLTGREIHTYDI